MNIKKFFKKTYAYLAKFIKGKAHFLPDRIYLNILYKASFNKKINWKNPVTYNEKLQWLKVYDKNKKYIKLVDKYEVKNIVSSIIGEKYIIPTLGVWDNFDDIDFNKLPNSFVLKCTHDSGGLVIVKDKKNLDIKEAKKKIEVCMNRNYFWFGREWPYKNIKPRIIAEKYMKDSSLLNDESIKDYKFFCFNGNPKLLFVASDRNKKDEDVKFDYFDLDFNKLDLVQSVHSTSNYVLDKPKSFEEMIEICKKLSKNIPQVRIDLYEIEGKTYFGEYTFFHHGGLVPFIPEKWDEELGNYIDLSKVNKNEK